MINPWTIYWICRLTAINIALHLFTFMFSVLFIITGVILLNEAAEFDEDLKKHSIKVSKYIKLIPMIGFPILVILIILVPDTKQMCATIIIPKIVNNEKIQDVGDKFYKLAIDWMEELSPTKTKEKRNGNR